MYIRHDRRHACQVDRLDAETSGILMSLGEDGEALCMAFASLNRNETSACACAMRLLRDRRDLKYFPPVVDMGCIVLKTESPHVLTAANDICCDPLDMDQADMRQASV